MHGLISQLMTKPQQRNELVQIHLGATKRIPGRVSYFVALDASRDDALSITRVWTEGESHAAAHELPAVWGAMAKGLSLITGMGSRITTRPVGGLRLQEDDGASIISPPGSRTEHPSR